MMIVNNKNKKASALIMVLWVIGLMSMLISSFAFDAHVESRITSYYRKRTKADYLSRSGLEIAEMLMQGAAEMPKDQDKTDEYEDDQWFDYKKKMKTGAGISGLVQELGDGEIHLDIIPEPARRNINLVKDDDWERIFEVCGIPEDMWPDLIDCYDDWVDKDDDPRLNGAESEDYYETLNPPYRADNDVLDTVEELLLIKGFTQSIVFGGPLQIEGEDEPVIVRGLDDLLTTYGDGKVNVNAASKEVLMTLPDVDDLVASAIIEERNGAGWADETTDDGEEEDYSFKSVSDFFTRLPDAPSAIRNYISVDSQVYRVRSTGVVHGVERTIQCIVQYSGRKMLILRWLEED